MVISRKMHFCNCRHSDEINLHQMWLHSHYLLIKFIITCSYWQLQEHLRAKHVCNGFLRIEFSVY